MTWGLVRSMSLAALVAAAGCLRDNPSYDADASGTGTGTGTGGASEDDGTAGSSGSSSSASADDAGDGTGGGTGDASSEGTVESSGGLDDGTSTSGTGDGTGTTGGPGTVRYTASVADCVGDDGLDPDACEAYAGPGEPGHMAIDTRSDDDERIVSYVAFDLDGTLAGKTVTSVTLRLTVTDAPWALSPSSGEVWQVQPFTRNGLFNAAPASVGGAALDGDKGAVDLDDVVEWSLPANLAVPAGSVYLGVFPLDSDGTYYWNTNGDAPPVLIVDYQ